MKTDSVNLIAVGSAFSVMIQVQKMPSVGESLNCGVYGVCCVTSKPKKIRGKEMWSVNVAR